MKRIALLWAVATLLVCASTPSHAQAKAPFKVHFRALPLHATGNPPHSARAAAAASMSSVPLWDYTVTAPRDGKTYTGTMVGRSPFFHGARTTNVETILVPLKVTLEGDGTIYDPDATDVGCLPNADVTPSSLILQSPILMPAPFTMNGVDEGSTQYVDAFRRANFFDAINPTGNRYHTLLKLVATISTAISINPDESETVQGPCGNMGKIDLSTFDSIVRFSLLPALAAQGVGPTKVPVFLLYNVVLQEGPFCCVLGYHSGTSSPSGIQLYAVADYDSTHLFGGPNDGTLNSTVMSHEIAELYDDPLVTNQTPGWGNTGQVSDCQFNLEVGDPLTGSFLPSITMPNGMTYDLQELAFFSWFFGGPPIGAAGLFSDNGSFIDDAGDTCL